jgi:hypothetical protein
VAEETVKLKAVLDLTDFQAQLQEAKNQLVAALSEPIGSGGGSVASGGGGGINLSGVGQGIAGAARNVQDFSGAVLSNLMQGVGLVAGAGTGLAGAYAQGLMPNVPVGQQVAWTMGAAQAPALHFQGQQEFDRVAREAQIRSREDYVKSAIFTNQAANVAGGIVGGAIGQALIPIPVVGALVGSYVGEKMAGGMTNFLFDEGRYRDHFMARDAIESLSFGAFSPGGGRSGYMDPTMSAELANRMMRRSYRSGGIMKTDEAADVLMQANQAGMFLGVGGGRSDRTSMLESIDSRQAELERQVRQLRHQTGTDTAGAIGMIQDTMMNFGAPREAAGRIVSEMSATARSAGVSMDFAMSLARTSARNARSMGFSGESGLDAAQMAMLMARNVERSGTFTTEQLMRQGGIEGIAENMMASHQSFTASNFGGMLAQLSVLKPGTMSAYMAGHISERQVQEQFASATRGMTEVQRDQLNLDGQRRMNSIGPHQTMAVESRGVVNAFNKYLNGAPATKEAFVAFAHRRMDLTEEQANVKWDTISTIINDPQKYQEDMKQVEKMADTQAASSEVQNLAREANAEERQQFIEGLKYAPGMVGLAFRAKDWWTGDPADGAKLEEATQSHVSAFDTRMSGMKGVTDKAILGRELGSALSEMTQKIQDSKKEQKGIAGWWARREWLSGIRTNVQQMAAESDFAPIRDWGISGLSERYLKTSEPINQASMEAAGERNAAMGDMAPGLDQIHNDLVAIAQLLGARG